MSKLSLTVHSDMQAWCLTCLVTDIQQESFEISGSVQKYSQRNVSLHWLKCWNHNALKSSAVSVWTWDTTRPPTNTSQDCWSRNALAGKGESVCVFCRSLSSKPYSSIQPVLPYHTTLRFIIFCVGIGWSILRQFMISKLCRSQKKKKKKVLLLCSQRPAEILGLVKTLNCSHSARVGVLCACPLWHHKGRASRTRRKMREEQTKGRLIKVVFFNRFMCLSIYIYNCLWCLSPGSNQSLKLNQLNSFF